MIIWFAILIPIIASFVAFLIFKKHLVWWEVLLPILISLMFISMFKFTVEKSLTTDTEYLGGIIYKIEYYEYYETWVHKTCTRSYKCGKSTCIATYDCSYCDEHVEQFFAYDTRGKKFNISRAKYEQLIKTWNSIPSFVELNRSINKNYRCGRDGNMYYITWDKNIKTSEASVVENSYENRIQAVHSAFTFPIIEKEKAQELGLYDYPNIYDIYRQNAILGIDGLYNLAQNKQIKKYYEYINGDLGLKKKCKLFVLVFQNKNISIANLQQAYWDGGNDNELVVCIGINKNKELQWTKAFSWTKNRRTIIEAREEIMSDSLFNPYKIGNILHTNVIPNHFKRRDFKEFSYLTVEPQLWAIITTYIITIIITSIVLYWGVNNDVN